jgi:tripartite-type tricarboxylate transporter receptor subunit TctC
LPAKRRSAARLVPEWIGEGHPRVVFRLMAAYAETLHRESFFGLGAPRNTPAEIVDKLNSQIGVALANPKMKSRIDDLGGTTFSSSPTEFGNLLAYETEKWGKVIRVANIRPS